MKQLLFICAITLCSSCENNTVTQIGDNIFVKKDKIYRIVDNEITEIGDLTKPVRKFEIAKPAKKNFGAASLNFIKPTASTNLDALYRGNKLYYQLTVLGLNDLKENYSDGVLFINFRDEYDFILHSVEVKTSELIRLLDDNKQTLEFDYEGNTEMSSDVNKAIVKYDVSASIKKKTTYSW